MKSKLFINILFSGLLLTFQSCHSSADHSHEDDNHEHNMGHEEEEHMDEVELTTIQIEKIGLKLGAIESKNLKSTLHVNGHLELPPQNKASVSALHEGQVTQIYVKPGQYVKKGSQLLKIQHPDFIEWQQQYLEAKGELAYLQKEYERQAGLLEKEVAAQKQFEQISAEKIKAEAQFLAMKSKLQLMGIALPDAGQGELASSTVVRSPISGYVRQIMTNTGAFILPEQKLFEIVDNHHIHIDFLVYEKDIDKIKVGQKINFILQSQASQLMEATIFALGKALEEEQRALKVHAEIDNDDGNLLPGMYVEGRIVLENTKVNALPDEAITVDKGLKYIFAKEEEHEDGVHFKKIQVLTGAQDFGYTEVTLLEEIPNTTEIVTKGAFFLMAQTKKGEEGAGHHH